jgi:hypothetical protein
MFHIHLAEEPFEYKGVLYENYYNYFILSVDQSIEGILEFDLSSTSFISTKCNNRLTYEDALIRTGLNYFLSRGFKSVTLIGNDFTDFKKKYLFNNVFNGNEINLERFFNIGCGEH